MSLKNSWLLACSCGLVWRFKTSPCTASTLSVSMSVGRRTHPASSPAPPTTTKALHKLKFHYPGTFRSTQLLMAYGHSTNFVVNVTGWKVWYRGSHRLWQPLKTQSCSYLLSYVCIGTNAQCSYFHPAAHLHWKFYIIMWPILTNWVITWSQQKQPVGVCLGVLRFLQN